MLQLVCKGNWSWIIRLLSFAVHIVGCYIFSNNSIPFFLDGARYLFIIFCTLQPPEANHKVTKANAMNQSWSRPAAVRSNGEYCFLTFCLHTWNEPSYSGITWQTLICRQLPRQGPEPPRTWPCWEAVSVVNGPEQGVWFGSWEVHRPEGENPRERHQAPLARGIQGVAQPGRPLPAPLWDARWQGSPSEEARELKCQETDSTSSPSPQVAPLHTSPPLRINHQASLQLWMLSRAQQCLLPCLFVMWVIRGVPARALNPYWVTYESGWMRIPPPWDIVFNYAFCYLLYCVWDSWRLLLLSCSYNCLLVFVCSVGLVWIVTCG